MWDPPPIAVGEPVTKTLVLRGAEPGDIVTATHSGLGSQHFAALITARVSAADEVTIVVMNMGGGKALDIVAGIVRAAIVQYV